MLQAQWRNLNKAMLLSAEMYKPYPSKSDRKSWDKIEEAVKQHYIEQAEALLEKEWELLPAIRYMDVVKNGNRSRYQDLYYARRQHITILFLAECIENKGRFVEQLINGVWAVCEESSWVVPAHSWHMRGEERDALPDFDEVYPCIDLFSAATGSLLAAVYYFMKEDFTCYSPTINERILYELNRRISVPYMERTDFWWMGFDEKKVNNWNPWINSNCLSVVLLTEQNVEKRNIFLEKCILTLQQFIDLYDVAGGCDEGPGYWNAAGGSLFDCLEQLYEVSGGQINLYHEEKIKNIGRYIYKVHIADERFVNFADSGSKNGITSSLVYRYGERICDPVMMNLGQERKSVVNEKGWHMYRGLKSLWQEKSEGLEPQLYSKDNWIEDIKVMTAREYASKEGLFLAAKGGHNDESHNHNDVGQFIVYSNGEPVIIDIGVETYTVKTFSDQRYEIWTMQSNYHNLPTINGYNQRDGEQYRATQVSYQQTQAEAVLSLELQEAYPKEAQIESWHRKYVLNRAAKQGYIEVQDCFKLEKATQDITFNLMTACQPVLAENHQVYLQVGEANCIQVTYDERLEATSESIRIEDEKLQSEWGSYLYRIQFKLKEKLIQGNLKMKFEQIRMKVVYSEYYNAMP